MVDSSTPFRILVLGDFSGRVNRGLHDGLAGRRPVLVDLDNFDDMMREMASTLRLPGADLTFRELDDFHPDVIYRDAAIFQKLAGMAYQPPRAAAAPIVSGGSLLESILEQSDEPSPATVEDAADLPSFIRKVTAGHLADAPDAGKAAWAARKEAVANEGMKAILHHPDFQALEAGWRAAWMLVQGLGDDVKVYLLDATLQEVIEDAAALAKMLGASRDPWALLVGNYAFGDSEQDAGRLTTLGRLAASANAPLLAEAQPPSGEEAPQPWQDLRRSKAAPWIGLAVPRFLLRLPYGKSTSEVESFAFEEMTGSVHGEYLWGNPAFCCAYLIGQAYRSEGWDLRPGIHRKVSGLPIHVYKDDGESVSKPCAEILLGEKDAELLLDSGYMPLASMKGQDTVMVLRFQSIADPPTGLAGRWNG